MTSHPPPRPAEDAAKRDDARRPSHHDADVAADERERLRARGMSRYIARRGTLFAAPLVLASVVLLGLEGRLRRMDLETFVVRVMGPGVAGLLVARMGWAKVVRGRLEAFDRGAGGD